MSMLSRTADHLFWTESGRAAVPAHGRTPDEGPPACKPAGGSREQTNAL
jgi:hypothetical protein